MTPTRRDSSRMISAGIQNQPDCQVAGLASRDSQHQLFQIYFIYRCQYLVENIYIQDCVFPRKSSSLTTAVTWESRGPAAHVSGRSWFDSGLLLPPIKTRQKATRLFSQCSHRLVDCFNFTRIFAKNHYGLSYMVKNTNLFRPGSNNS